MTDRVNLHLGTAYCSILLCSVRSLDVPWALNCRRQTQYQHLHFCKSRLPIGSCGLSVFHCGYIIEDASAKILDTPLTLILRHTYDLVVSIFA